MFSKVARVTILTLVLIALIFLKERFPDKKEKEDALYLQDFEDMTVDQHWFSPALLVIEDERKLARFIRQGLEQHVLREHEEDQQ